MTEQQLAKVIPLFREDRPVVKDEPFEPYVVLSEELQDSIVETAKDMETLWLAASTAEFTAIMRGIKREVATWPEEAPDG